MSVNDALGLTEYAQGELDALERNLQTACAQRDEARRLLAQSQRTVGELGERVSALVQERTEAVLARQAADARASALHRRAQAIEAVNFHAWTIAQWRGEVKRAGRAEAAHRRAKMVAEHRWSEALARERVLLRRVAELEAIVRAAVAWESEIGDIENAKDPPAMSAAVMRALGASRGLRAMLRALKEAPDGP